MDATMTDGPMFTIEDTARAAGITPNTLRQQFTRGHFDAIPIKPAAHPGDPRLLSTNSVLAVAIANALARLGVPLSRGAQAGNTFAHSNSGIPPRAHPGALYDRGDRTFMGVPPGDRPIEIFRLGAQFSGIELATAIGGEVGVIACLNPIVERVEQELKRHEG